MLKFLQSLESFLLFDMFCMNLSLELLTSQMTELQTECSCQLYLYQLKTCILLARAVQSLSAAGSTPGCINDQQYDFGQDLFLSSLYLLPFYLLYRGFFDMNSFFPSFFYAISATLILVKSYTLRITGVFFYSSK